ncbi:MAG: chemotaxis protein CheX [Planctomycetota bacterium]|nr:chemotaxis protein CheX [Sulfitobacter sp.]MDF1837446.1 chemotaxis protein CheX [Planctomycetota bacterium]
MTHPFTCPEDWTKWLSEGTSTGLQMAMVTPTYLKDEPELETGGAASAMIYFSGPVSGSFFLNMDKEALLYLAGEMLMEEQKEINEDVIDALGEIANLTAGATKDVLQAAGISVEGISVPSVMLGSSFQMFHTPDTRLQSVTFTLEGMDGLPEDKRQFSINVALAQPGAPL